jgi:hypothetical protein
MYSTVHKSQLWKHNCIQPALNSLFSSSTSQSQTGPGLNLLDNRRPEPHQTNHFDAALFGLKSLSVRCCSEQQTDARRREEGQALFWGVLYVVVPSCRRRRRTPRPISSPLYQLRFGRSHLRRLTKRLLTRPHRRSLPPTRGTTVTVSTRMVTLWSRSRPASLRS